MGARQACGYPHAKCGGDNSSSAHAPKPAAQEASKERAQPCVAKAAVYRDACGGGGGIPFLPIRARTRASNPAERGEQKAAGTSAEAPSAESPSGEGDGGGGRAAMRVTAVEVHPLAWGAEWGKGHWRLITRRTASPTAVGRPIQGRRTLFALHIARAPHEEQTDAELGTCQNIP